MKFIILTAVIVCFHVLSRADELTASIVTKQNGELVLVSDSLNQNWDGENGINSLDNLNIKGVFSSQNGGVLVFDLKAQTVAPSDETFVMTSDQKLLPAEIDTSLNAVKISVDVQGNVATALTDSAKDVNLGKLSLKKPLPSELFLRSNGDIIDAQSNKLSSLTVNLIADLQGQISILSGSGSEVVISGEKPEFLSSLSQLQTMNANQQQNPAWKPLLDLKISSFGSVLQVEFKTNDSGEFSLFKLMSPLIVNQVKESSAP